jgi:hypothetical protein
VDARELRVGDRVRATRNDYRHGVLTGRVGTVTALNTEAVTVTVTFDTDSDGRGRVRPERTVTLDAAFLHERDTRSRAGVLRAQAPGLTHAYASTAHAVQGRTTMRGYVLLADAGLSRQAAYVACSRAKLVTHLYAITVPDYHEEHRHDREAAAPDPNDLTAIARAMARDAAQELASAADPHAREMAALVAMPTPWLHARRAELAASVGAPPSLEESLRRIRTSLADAYGRVPLEQLECPQLRSALTRVMRVPGATPERVAELLISRSAPVRRELTSARDPIAVLVWAASHGALPTLAAAAASRPASADLEAATTELRRLDSALARQRESRLLAAETSDDGPLTALLGRAPSNPSSLGMWRRASAAIFDYRDMAGVFDRDSHDPDPFIRALGCRPTDPTLAAHHDQVVGIVRASRVTLALAELSRYATAGAARPTPAAEGLAVLDLRQLDQIRAAPNSDERRCEIDDAIQWRESTLRHGVLVNPPDWVKEDIAARLDAPTPLPLVGQLAAAYAAVAVEADRTGLAPADVLASIGPSVAVPDMGSVAIEPDLPDTGLGF